MYIGEMARAIHKCAEEHGWHEGGRDDATWFAMIHTEWSEALEAYRVGEPMEYPGEDGKPEGVCVELIDGCMRILDWMVDAGRTPEYINEKQYAEKKMPDVPELVNGMHNETAMAFGMLDLPGNAAGLLLTETIAKVFAWVEWQGCNPMEIMRKKHEYNKNRPYRHGGKVC